MISRPLRIALLYLLLSALWIFVSYYLLQQLFVDSRLVEQLELLGGLSFVLISALVLFLLLRREHAAVERANGTLRERERNFRMLTETIATAIFLHRGGRLCFVNPKAVAYSGYTREELLSMDLWQLVSPEYQDMVRERSLSRLHGTGGPARYELKIITKQGEERWLEVTADSIEFEGAPVALASAYDITERKQAESALKKLVEGTAQVSSEKFFPALVQQLALALKTRYAIVAECLDDDFNKAGVLAFWKDGGWAPVFEYDMRNTPCQTMLKQGGVCYYPEQVQQAFPGNSRLPALNAESYLGVPLYSTEKKIIGHLFVMDDKPLHAEPHTQSILGIFAARAAAELERMQVEQALQRRIASEQAAQQRVVNILESITDAFVSLDNEWRYTYVNAKAAQLFGRNAGDLIGRHIWTEFPEGIGQPFYLAYYKAVAEKTPLFLEEYYPPWKRWFENRIFPSTEGLSIFFHDITERKHAEQDIRSLNSDLERRVAERTSELEKANAQLRASQANIQILNVALQQRAEELQASVNEMEAFSYSVSHDLRAPLRAIQGFTQALQEDYAAQLDLAGQDFAQRIVAAAGRMDILIQDLLTYSQLSRSELSPKPVSLSIIVAEATSQLQAQIAEHHAVISVAEPLPDVLGHRPTLVQVIANLLSNAIKFVAPGVTPQIRVWAEAQENRVRLWVEDNGIGIPAEHEERIFRVFERLHGIETYPGTGIGLAIVKKGMERMGGSVGVASQNGQGSRFWIELPIQEEK